MARAEITVVKITNAGQSIEGNDVAFDQPNGMMFVNNRKTFLAVKNADASPHTVAIPTPATVQGLAVAEGSVVIPDGETVIIGPFTVNPFEQGGSDRGKVYVDIDDGTSVTVAAFTL